ncbi:hypothetical protein ACLKA7_001745 [Drosophila subpalustris]
MPFGLHSAPATFHRALDSVKGPDMEPFVFAYLDAPLMPISRQPLEVALQVSREEESTCKWITRLTKRILEAPDRFPDFTIEGSQVYRHLSHRPEEENYVPWKLCVAFDHRPRVLAECHDHPTAGHLCFRKTMARISQRYYWPGLFRDVARYVKQCEKCQKFKESQLKPAGRMLTRQVEERFGTLCADFVVPLPRSKHGNTMLLVFFDAFTKWVELIPLRMATSAHLERAF